MSENEESEGGVNVYVTVTATEDTPFEVMFEAANRIQAEAVEQVKGARDVGGGTSFTEGLQTQRDLDFEVPTNDAACDLIGAVAALLLEAPEFENAARFNIVTPEERMETLRRLAGEDAPPVAEA